MQQNEDRFLELVQANPVNREPLDRLQKIELPNWYLVAGCLVQTVWNALTGHPLERGILDYDVFYCDLEDLSWEGEDKIINQCDRAFSDLGVEVQVRNQARVHLWYGEKFGVSAAPLTSSRAAIDTFLGCCSCFGVRKESNGNLSVYAPFGYDDLFQMVVRPNVGDRNSPLVYEKKAERWQRMWPEVTVLPWPD